METKKVKLLRIIAGALFIAAACYSFFTMLFDGIVFNSAWSGQDILTEFLINSAFIVVGVFLLINKNDIPVIAGFGTLTFITIIIFFGNIASFISYPRFSSFSLLFANSIKIALFAVLTGFSVLRKIKPQFFLFKMWYIPSAIGAIYFLFYLVFRISILCQSLQYSGFSAFLNFSSYTTLALLQVAGAVIYSMFFAEKAKGN